MPETIQKGRKKGGYKSRPAPAGGCPRQCRREEGNAAMKVGYKSRLGASGERKHVISKGD